MKGYRKNLHHNFSQYQNGLKNVADDCRCGRLKKADMVQNI